MKSCAVIGYPGRERKMELSCSLAKNYALCTAGKIPRSRAETALPKLFVIYAVKNIFCDSRGLPCGLCINGIGKREI